MFSYSPEIINSLSVSCHIAHPFCATLPNLQICPHPPHPPCTKTHNPQMPRENIASTNNTHLKITQTKQSQSCLSLVFWIPERVPLLKVICHAALGSHSNTHMPTFHAFLFLLFIRLEINLHLAALINNAWLKKEGKVSQKP